MLKVFKYLSYDWKDSKAVKIVSREEGYFFFSLALSLGFLSSFNGTCFFHAILYLRKPWKGIEETVKSTRLHQSTKRNMKINQDSYDQQTQWTRSLKSS